MEQVTLILGPESVAAAQGLRFALQPATKHPENPVLIPGFPHEWDSLQIHWPSCVLYDPAAQRFRAWYHGLDVVQYDSAHDPARRPFARWLGRIWRVGYAESADGVHWDKPPLGQYTHRGATTNALQTDYEKSGTGHGFDHCADLHHVWLNPHPVTPDERFCGLFVELGADAEGNRSFRTFRKVLYTAGENQRWMRRQVLYEAPSDSDIQPARDVVDLSALIVDEDDPDPARRVKAYGQTDQGGNHRAVGMVYGPDLGSLRYEGLRLVLEPNPALEDELHWSTVCKLSNGYYALLHDSDRFSYDGTGAPQGDLRLAFSRDGLDFRRVHPTTPLIPRGSKAMWDANQLVTGSIVEYGDAVYLYYHGTPCLYRPWPYPPAGVPFTLRASTLYPSFLGLATLPRDRWAYATPAERAGTLRTLPLTLSTGAALWLNAEAGVGELDVTLLDVSGQVAAIGRLGTRVSQTVYRALEWDPPTPPGVYALQVTLRGSARLFALKHAAPDGA